MPSVRKHVPRKVGLRMGPYTCPRRGGPPGFRRPRGPQKPMLAPKRGLKRKAGSRTATTTKRRRTTPTRVADDLSESYFSYGRLRMAPSLFKLYKKVLGRRTAQYMDSNQLNVPSGQQGILQNCFISAGDLQTIATDVGSTLVTGTYSTDVSVFMGYHTYRVYLKNQTNLSCKLQLYDIAVRKLPQEAKHATPYDAWITGGVGMRGSTANATAWVATPGTTPQFSPDFNQYYKVIRVTDVYLTPGEQHNHIVKRRINRIVKSSRFANVTASYPVPGLSHYFMFVCQPNLVHDSTTKTNINFGPARIDVVFQQEYSYGYLPSSVTTYSLSNTLNTVTTAVAEVLNIEASGVIADA